jgi:large subunit ribosomal protein L29
MNKAKDLREMSDDQLTFALREARESLFRLRFQAATERLDAPSNLRRMRRDIARIKTILAERERAAAATAAAAPAPA